MTATEVVRAKCVADTMFATRYFFAQQNGQKFYVGRHHKIIAAILDEVFSGKITRLIINLPPRYSKTEMVVKTFIAKGLGINPKAKFIHLSYSANLALDNSEKTKEMVESAWYRQLFPNVEISPSSDAKQKWYTTAGGGVYATSSSGQVTGFGAGTVNTDTIQIEDLEEFLYRPIQSDGDDEYTFGGAIIIDDPLKPIDANSPVMRDKVNEQFDNTIRSRINDTRTPIIVIMQRVHKDDLSGYLQREDEPEDWTVISMPALSTDEDGNEVALYPFKHTVEDLHNLRKANRFVFETQYQQSPKTINEKRWLFAFDPDKHTGKVEYNPEQPLYASFDFNRNPMTCTLFQHYGGTIYGVECIRLEDATTRMVCQEIDKKYPDAFLIVTGDCAGKNSTTVSLLNNYDIVKNYFRLSKARMQYHSANPRLADSRYFMNSIFEEYNIIYDSEKCKPAIFDFENVQADDDNKPVKTNRENEAQKADFLDNNRYYFHRYFKQFQPAKQQQ